MHFTLLHSWVIHTSLYSAWFSCLGATKHKDMQHYSAGLCGALDLKQKQGYIIARQQVKRLLINSQIPTLWHWNDRQVMARLHVCATLSQGTPSLRQKVTSVAAAQLTSVKNNQDLNPSLKHYTNLWVMGYTLLLLLGRHHSTEWKWFQSSVITHGEGISSCFLKVTHLSFFWIA